MLIARAVVALDDLPDVRRDLHHTLIGCVEMVPVLEADRIGPTLHDLEMRDHGRHVGAAADAGRDISATPGLRPIDVTLLGARSERDDLVRKARAAGRATPDRAGEGDIEKRLRHHIPACRSERRAPARRDLRAAGVEGGRVRRLDRDVDDQRHGIGDSRRQLGSWPVCRTLARSQVVSGIAACARQGAGLVSPLRPLVF